MKAEPSELSHFSYWYDRGRQSFDLSVSCRLLLRRYVGNLRRETGNHCHGNHGEIDELEVTSLEPQRIRFEDARLIVGYTLPVVKPITLAGNRCFRGEVDFFRLKVVLFFATRAAIGRFHSSERFFPGGLTDSHNFDLKVSSEPILPISQ